MTVVLVVGVLTFAAVLAILRPFLTARRQSQAAVPAPEEARRRELLRQLRDLDDDLAAGKLSQVDHDRLAGPVQREAAAVLRGGKNREPTAGGTRGPDAAGRAGSMPVRATAGMQGTRLKPRRWRLRSVTVVALAGGIAGVTILLLGAVTPRTAGETATGGAAGPASAQPAASPNNPSSGGGQQATPEQLAAIDDAAGRVKANPKDVGAHLDLANAYAAGGASQLAAVEYLAVIKLDPTNAAANTTLAQLAYAAGQTKQAKAMLDTALAAHPKYPEALYARGLILLTVLHQPQAAEKDLNAYLEVAPFGEQRTQVETLLALAGSQGHR